jgi:hypothetical protein
MGGALPQVECCRGGSTKTKVVEECLEVLVLTCLLFASEIEYNSSHLAIGPVLLASLFV